MPSQFPGVDAENLTWSLSLSLSLLLASPEMLVAVHASYHRVLSGLYSDTPLLGVFAQDDRDEMLQMLRRYRSSITAGA